MAQVEFTFGEKRYESPAENTYGQQINIKIIGVGGGGSNAVNRMISENIDGIETIVANTDSQALNMSCAARKLMLGKNTTEGRGAGANPELGRKSAEESIEDIKKLLVGTNMLFITAGMGGGTGTGAAPVIAKIAKEELGILTIGIVTKPFGFEGNRRMKQAEAGIEQLSAHVDSLIVIPNDKLKSVSKEKLTIDNAFEIADRVLLQGVKAVSDLFTRPSHINLDFADVTSVMKDAGRAHMGIGVARGDDKATIARLAAVDSPLLETKLAGAQGVLINFTVNPNNSLEEIEMAAEEIQKQAHPDANIIWGLTYDTSFDNEMQITIIATGFDKMPAAIPTPVAAQAEKQQIHTVAAEPVYPVEDRPEQPKAQEPKRVEPTPEPDDGETSFISQKQPKSYSEMYNQIFTCIKKKKDN